jgi:hypothetical protein
MRGTVVTGNVPDEAGVLAGRLIGPAGPELSCEECFDVLDVYVERELAGGDAGGEMPAMREHLAGCSACRDDRDSLLALLRKGLGG